MDGHSYELTVSKCLSALADLGEGCGGCDPPPFSLEKNYKKKIIYTILRLQPPPPFLAEWWTKVVDKRVDGHRSSYELTVSKRLSALADLGADCGGCNPLSPPSENLQKKKKNRLFWPFFLGLQPPPPSYPFKKN